MKNQDIRVMALQSGVKFWQIAAELEISPETFSKRMRKEMPPSEKQSVIHAIERIANHGKGETQ